MRVAMAVMRQRSPQTRRLASQFPSANLSATLNGGVVDGGGFAVAGEVVLQHLPRTLQVVGVFEAIGPGGLSAAEGLPVSVGNCICIPVADLSSWLRRRTLAGSRGSVPRVP